MPNLPAGKSLIKTQQGLQIVNTADLQKYGIRPTAQMLDKPTSTNPVQGLVNALPGIGGGLGAVGAALIPGVGESGVGEVAGAGAGGSAGEALKEWINQNILKSQPKSGANIGDILKQGGINALFGLLPGADELLGVKGAADAAASNGADFVVDAAGNAVKNTPEDLVKAGININPSEDSALATFGKNFVKRSVGGAGIGAATSGIADLGTNKSANEKFTDLLHGAATVGLMNSLLIPGISKVAKGITSGIPSHITDNLDNFNSQVINEREGDINSILQDYGNKKSDLITQAMQKVFSNNADLQDFAKEEGLLDENGIVKQGLDPQTLKQILQKSQALQKQYQAAKASLLQGKITPNVETALDDNGNPIAPEGLDKSVQNIMDKYGVKENSPLASLVNRYFKGGSGTSGIGDTLSIGKQKINLEDLTNLIKKGSLTGGKLFKDPNNLDMTQLESFRKDLGSLTNFSQDAKFEQKAANEMYGKVKSMLENGAGVDNQLKQINGKIAGHEAIQQRIGKLTSPDNATPLGTKYSKEAFQQMEDVKNKQLAEKLGIKSDKIDIPGQMGERVKSIQNEMLKGNFEPLKQFAQELKQENIINAPQATAFQNLINAMSGNIKPKLSPGIDIALNIIPILGYASPARFIGYIFGRGVESSVKRMAANPSAGAAFERTVAGGLQGIGNKVSGVGIPQALQQLMLRASLPNQNQNGQ